MKQTNWKQYKDEAYKDEQIIKIIILLNRSFYVEVGNWYLTYY